MKNNDSIILMFPKCSKDFISRQYFCEAFVVCLFALKLWNTISTLQIIIQHNILCLIHGCISTINNLMFNVWRNSAIQTIFIYMLAYIVGGGVEAAWWILTK